MRAAGTLAFLLLLLAVALVGVYLSVYEFETVDMGFHGAFAMILGAVLLVLITGGLMGLLFFSARTGRDQNIGVPGDDEDGDDPPAGDPRA